MSVLSWCMTVVIILWLSSPRACSKLYEVISYDQCPTINLRKRRKYLQPTLPSKIMSIDRYTIHRRQPLSSGSRNDFFFLICARVVKNCSGGEARRQENGLPDNGRIPCRAKKEASAEINYPLYQSKFTTLCSTTIGITGYKVALN